MAVGDELKRELGQGHRLKIAKETLSTGQQEVQAWGVLGGRRLCTLRVGPERSSSLSSDDCEGKVAGTSRTWWRVDEELDHEQGEKDRQKSTSSYGESRNQKRTWREESREKGEGKEGKEEVAEGEDEERGAATAGRGGPGGGGGERGSRCLRAPFLPSEGNTANSSFLFLSSSI